VHPSKEYAFLRMDGEKTETLVRTLWAGCIIRLCQKAQLWQSGGDGQVEVKMVTAFLVNLKNAYDSILAFENLVDPDDLNQERVPRLPTKSRERQNRVIRPWEPYHRRNLRIRKSLIISGCLAWIRTITK
jgi:hypothetical protein